LLRTKSGYFDRMSVAPNSRKSDSSLRCSDWVIFESKKPFVMEELNRLIELAKLKQTSCVKLGYSFEAAKDHRDIISKKLKMNWNLIEN